MNVLSEKLVSKAALYFLEGQYLFRYKDQDEGIISKYVTPEDLAAAFTMKESDSGWMPAGVVRSGTNKNGKWYVYSAPAQKAEIIIDPDEKLTFPIPRTVLLGVGNKNYLWVIKSKYFDPEAEAFYAPFPNVYCDAEICWGNSQREKSSVQIARETWNLFFSSRFNKDYSDGKSEKNKKNIVEVLREISSSSMKKYPEYDLVSVKKTIGSVIDEIIWN